MKKLLTYYFQKLMTGLSPSWSIVVEEMFVPRTMVNCCMTCIICFSYDGKLLYPIPATNQEFHLLVVTVQTPINLSTLMSRAHKALTASSHSPAAQVKYNLAPHPPLFPLNNEPKPHIWIPTLVVTVQNPPNPSTCHVLLPHSQSTHIIITQSSSHS
jgi:hypothetical protein